MRRIVALTIVLAPLVAFATQQDIPRFTSGVDVVQFTVTVLDKERRPVTGLTAADFEVLVDGKPKPLAAFAQVTLPEDVAPAVMTTAATVSPDVHTNRLAPEGRLVVIVMDRSIPDGQPMPIALASANAAIDRLGPADLGAVVFTAWALQKYSQGFTADRVRLHAAVSTAFIGAVHDVPDAPSLADAIRAMGGTSASPPLTRGQLAPDELSGECRCGICVPDALTEIAKALSPARVRQKSIIFIGSYIAIATPSLDCNPYVYPARDRLTRALDEANVTMHVVDPSGLEALADTAEDAGPVGRAKWAAARYRQELLAWLPDYTGGRAVMNRNTPWDRMGSIFDESRSYYVLAIARDTAAAAGADDRHRVEVSVKRSGAVVHAPHLSYAGDVTPKTETRITAAGALAELLPRADFPLQMNLAPQFSEDGSPEIRVSLGVGAATAGRLDVVIGAFDPLLRPVGTTIKQRLDVPARAVAGSSAFQWTSVLKPPPGRYEVRAAVATADGNRAASVMGYVDVPDVQKAGVALSGVVVKTRGAPTLRRTFAPGEAMTFSVQVARGKTAGPDVSVEYLLSDERGRTLSNGTVPAAAAASGKTGIQERELAIEAPRAPGRYIITFQAGDGRRASQRDVLFIVGAR